MLLRSLQITDPEGPYDGQILDLRTSDGLIKEMAPSLEAEAGEEVVDFGEAYATPGFIDLGAYLGDPGHEEREDIESLRAQAAAGGYVGVATLPNTDPICQSVADVAYLLRQNGEHPTDLYPIAALSKDFGGKDLVSMLELNAAGAACFTDGPKRRVSGSLLKRALEYSLVRDLLVMIAPYDEALVPEGQIHEGVISTRLGLKGIPRMSEVIPLKRAMELQDYTEGKLLVHLLSTAAGVEEIRQRKAAGHRVFATVSAHHLFFTVGELAGFDPNFKMLPPLREEEDRQALIEGVKDGTIDCIVSNQVARHGEEKELEFSYADFGTLGLQTAFRQALAVLDGHLSLGEICRRFNYQARLLLGKETLHLRPGAPAQITLFTPAGQSAFTTADLKGKTRNSPLLDRELPGKILGVLNNGVFRAAK